MLYITCWYTAVYKKWISICTCKLIGPQQLLSAVVPRAWSTEQVRVVMSSYICDYAIPRCELSSLNSPVWTLTQLSVSNFATNRVNSCIEPKKWSKTRRRVGQNSQLSSLNSYILKTVENLARNIYIYSAEQSCIIKKSF